MPQREIKFRAWDREEKVMYYFDRMSFRNEYNVLEFGCDWTKYNLDYGDLPLEDDAPIMQFTGLKDKNGKEIYEGDIVKSPEGQLVLVKWDGVCFYPFNHCGHWFSGKESEVIGNIYENSNLLENAKK